MTKQTAFSRGEPNTPVTRWRNAHEPARILNNFAASDSVEIKTTTFDDTIEGQLCKIVVQAVANPTGVPADIVLIEGKDYLRNDIFDALLFVVDQDTVKVTDNVYSQIDRISFPLQDEPGVLYDIGVFGQMVIPVPPIGYRFLNIHVLLSSMGMFNDEVELHRISPLDPSFNEIIASAQALNQTQIDLDFHLTDLVIPIGDQLEIRYVNGGLRDWNTTYTIEQ